MLDLVMKTPAEKEIDIYIANMTSFKHHCAFGFWKESLMSDQHRLFGKKEYIEWITEAKSDETRNLRIETAVEWMAEDKIRNCKYIKK